MPDIQTLRAFERQLIFLYAEDTETAWRFYKDVLQLKLVRDQGHCRIYEAAPGGRALLGICRARAPRTSRDPRAEGGVMVTFVVQDVDGWYTYLKANGVAVPRAPELNTQYGVYHFFFYDPAGYTLEIQRFENAT